MTISREKFRKRLEVLFKNLGYFVESSLSYRDLIIFDLEFATTNDKLNVIYVGDLKTFDEYESDIKAYSKKNTILLFDKRVGIRVRHKVWFLKDLADIEKCGYLGCVRFPGKELVK